MLTRDSRLTKLPHESPGFGWYDNHPYQQLPGSPWWHIFAVFGRDQSHPLLRDPGHKRHQRQANHPFLFEP